MTNRKSTQENIQRISRQIADFNAELIKKNPLALLDIDLLRKYTIDLYDEVNQLRLVMKENLDGEMVRQETVRPVEVEVEIKVDEKVSGQNPEPDTHNPEPLNLEALTKAEIEVEAEAEVEAMVDVIVEEESEEEARLTSAPLSMTDITDDETPEPETLNPEPGPEIKLAAAEAKVEADAINAALNPEEANDLAYKFSNSPIHDLKKAISIAKKFEFINSLFGGNVEKYAYSIHHINNLNNGDEAFTYLHDLRKEWKWDDEDKNFQELANLIRRRYLG